jgi:DNA ligase (NAD+)
MSLLDRTTFFLTTTSHDESFIRASIDELRLIIKEHNERYYLTSDPVISDVQYDQLFALLKEREEQFPELVTLDSPTQRLVGQTIEGFTSAPHTATMGSLQNTYNWEDIIKRDDWVKRIQAKEWRPNRTFVIEPKLDGMSVEIVYESWVFVRAVTRGDGDTGEDITQHALWLRGLPKRIDALHDIETVALRGEIVMPRDAFARLEGTLTTSWWAFANPRNATAGTLRQLDTSLVATRGLEIVVYDLLFTSTPIETITTASERFSSLQSRWFVVSDMIYYCNTIQEVVQFCLDEKTKQQAEESRIELDGLVIKINEFVTREQLWATNHHPKRAIAYKFPAQQIATQLLGVTFQVGRTGVLTPVAELAPVNLSGVTISRATLHNRAFIVDRWLMLHDWVLIQRSWEVIPYIVSVLPHRRDGTQTTLSQPTHCPVCTHDVILDDQWLTLRCTNTDCDAQRKERLIHAVGKNCLDLWWLGPRLVELFVDTWLLATIADLPTLFSVQNKQTMRSLPGVWDKKIDQIEHEYTQKAPRPLRRVIHALCIRHIGEVSSRDLMEAWIQTVSLDDAKKDLKRFLHFVQDTERLNAIYWFGPEMVASLVAFFHDSTNQAIFSRLDASWMIDRVWTVGSSTSDQKLLWLNIVITWAFACGRDRLENYVREQWATLQAWVSSTTSFVIAGDWGWSKRAKAQERGIRIVSLEEFVSEWGSESWFFDYAPQKMLVQQDSLFG